MFCTRCGNEVPNDAVVCTKCGVATENFAKGGSVSQGVIVSGYVLAFLVPLIGGIVGLYLLLKNEAGHGIGILVLAVCSFFFWMGVLGVA